MSTAASTAVTTAAATTATTNMGEGDNETAGHASANGSNSSLAWYDYMEVVFLLLACVVGFIGNLTVLKVSLRIRSFSRQIYLLFLGLLSADMLVCVTRIPTAVYLIFSYSSSTSTLVGSHDVTLAATTPKEMTSTSAKLTSPLTWWYTGPSTSPTVAGDGSHGNGEGGGEETGMTEDKVMEVDLACEVWSASSALMMTIVWLHLIVGVQRLVIIFAFSKYRKVFTRTCTSLMMLGAWVLGLVAVYCPLRALGRPVQRAGRGACRVSPDTGEGILLARSLTTTFLTLVPLCVTLGCYVTIMRSVWLAREVRADAVLQYNRVVRVTFVRLLSLALTYFPFCLLLMVDVKGVHVPDTAHRLAGHLLWLQSIVSPYITLQDNDFRDKMMMPKQPNGTAAEAAKGQQQAQGDGDGCCGGDGDGAGGAEGNGVVMPDIGSSGGQDGEEHRARNLAEMRRERDSRRRQLQRGVSFITLADRRT